MKKLLRAACALVTCVGLSCTVCAVDSSLFDRIYNHVEENAPHTKAPAEAAGTDLTAAFDAFTKDAVSYAEEKGVAVKQIVKKKAVKFSDEKIEAEIRRWFGR
jgi:dihydropteroate synthase